jgi:glyoxylase-like metal-dependent hydrolase (beta-lactamase superfamily II)
MNLRNQLSIAVISIACTIVTCVPASADSVFSTERQLIKIAEGIYLIRHKDPFPGWVDGNTTVVIGDRQVLVVDSCQTLSAAQEDIAQIRKWTDKPVAYLLNTHWHQDHNGGNKAYLDAFPAISIVAHPETRAMMDVTSPNLGGEMRKQAEDLRMTVRKRLDSGVGSDGKPLTEQKKADAKEYLAEADALIEQAKIFVYQPPTFLVDRDLTIDLGNRTVRVMHPGRGNTGGDIVAYLPQEKLLVAGDLVVHPIPYTFDGYPSEWIGTLQQLTQLKPTTIVPGHGEILYDTSYIELLREMMKTIIAQIDAQIRANREISLADLQKSIDWKPFRERFCGTDNSNCGFFDYSVGEKFVELAYHEAKAR